MPWFHRDGSIQLFALHFLHSVWIPNLWSVWSGPPRGRALINTWYLQWPLIAKEHSTSSINKWFSFWETQCLWGAGKAKMENLNLEGRVARGGACGAMTIHQAIHANILWSASSVPGTSTCDRQMRKMDSQPWTSCTADLCVTWAVTGPGLAHNPLQQADKRCRFDSSCSRIPPQGTPVSGQEQQLWEKLRALAGRDRARLCARLCAQGQQEHQKPLLSALPSIPSTAPDKLGWRRPGLEVRFSNPRNCSVPGLSGNRKHRSLSR